MQIADIGIRQKEGKKTYVVVSWSWDIREFQEVIQ